MVLNLKLKFKEKMMCFSILATSANISKNKNREKIETIVGY
jgi:hypothetical protein